MSESLGAGPQHLRFQESLEQILMNLEGGKQLS